MGTGGTPGRLPNQRRGSGIVCAAPVAATEPGGNDMEIEGKAAVVSGGGSGIGRAAVLDLVKAVQEE